MAENNELKKRIMEVAAEKFLTYGYSRVRTDELARELGISKRTLYEYFSGKEELAREVILAKILELDSHIVEILNDKSLQFMGKLSKLFQKGMENLSKFPESIMYDFRRYAPAVYDEIVNYRRTQMKGNIENLIRQGISAGDFKETINVDMLVLVFTESTTMLMQPEILHSLPLTQKQIFEQFTNLFFEGLLTAEGRESLLDEDGNDTQHKG